MDRIPVNSSAIIDIGYDYSSMTLELAFKQGTIYQYFDVSEAVYQELMRAESKGTFFHLNIKNNYRYTKL
jgi:hypothetical protein